MHLGFAVLAMIPMSDQVDNKCIKVHFCLPVKLKSPVVQTLSPKSVLDISYEKTKIFL